MKLWGKLQGDTLPDVVRVLKFMLGERESDVQDFNGLNKKLIAGRRVLGRIPSSSSDILADDRIGDISYTTTFLYILMDNAGTPVWRRVALSSF